MSRAANQVTLTFAGDTKDIEGAFNRVGKSAQDIGGDLDAADQKTSRWKEGFGKLNKVATGALLGIGGAVAGAVGTMVSAGDEIAKAARTAGVSAEPFQELRFAFEQAGIDAGTFDSSMRRLNRRLGLAADGGGPAKDAFAELGIAIHDSGGNIRDTTAVLEEALPALAAIESDAERAAQASKLFGEDAGPGLAAALADGTDGIEEARQKAHELGIVMDGEALSASEDFSDAMDDMKRVGVGLIRDFATPFLNVLSDKVLPALEDKVIPAVRSMGEWMSENQTTVLVVAGVLGGLAIAIKTVAVAIQIFRTVAMVATAAQWAWNIAMTANPIGVIIVAIAALIAIIVLIATQTTWFQDIWSAAWGWIKDAASAVGRFFKETVWENWILGSFQAIGDWIGNVVGWFTDIPGKIGRAFSNIWDTITSPFKSAFNRIADMWNGTVGNLSWTVPSWVPFIGGNTVSAPTLPKFHTGGHASGAMGEEFLAVLRAGERVVPSGGGDSTVRLEIDTDGSALGEALLELLGRAVAVRGGDVQLVLGGSRG